jgi:hypothetical protein
MRLGQVASALGVNEKTTDNAIRTLGLARPLDEDTVCALGLALRAKYRYGIPLKRGFAMVREAMIRPDLREKDPVVREVFTYLPDIERRVQDELTHYKPLPRGPGWRDPYHPEVPARDRRHPAIRRAIQWGLDLSLNYSALERNAGQRLADFSAFHEDLRKLREAKGRQERE